ncbi:MAG: 6-pyruvoyl-tetrahydropterin synthase-related protein [Spirulinaceae cyanobacterium]
MISKLSTLFQQHSTRKTYLIEFILILGLILATILINLRMIRYGISGLGDFRWHITWIQHFSTQLREGIWYPRWLAGTNYGYGSPTFVFYPPLIYYLGSGLKLLGLNIDQTLAILFSTALFLSGLTFYIFARHKWGQIPAFIAALCYMTCPGIISLINGGTLAFLFSAPLIPLGFYLTNKAIHEPKWRIPLSLSWSVLALTHVPSLLLYTIAWFVYLGFLIRKNNWQSIILTTLTTGVGFGLVSLYLLPATLEKSGVNVEYMKSSRGTFQEKMLDVSQMLSGGLSDIIFKQLLAVAAFAIICFFISSRNREIAKQAGLWLIYVLIVLFFISEWSWPVWSLSETLQQVQSSWRLGFLFYFGQAALCGLAVKGILNLRLRYRIFPLVLILTIIFANFHFGYKMTRKFPAINSPGGGEIPLGEWIETALYDPYSEKLVDVPEYVPLLENGNHAPYPKIDQPKVSLVEGRGDFQISKWASYQRLIQVNAEEKSLLKVRTYYYPGWHLYVNDQPEDIEVLPDGTMGINIEPGSSLIKLKYQQTPVFQLGILFSILSVFAFIGFSLINLRTSTKISKHEPN